MTVLCSLKSRGRTSWGISATWRPFFKLTRVWLVSRAEFSNIIVIVHKTLIFNIVFQKKKEKKETRVHILFDVYYALLLKINSYWKWFLVTFLWSLTDYPTTSNNWEPVSPCSLQVQEFLSSSDAEMHHNLFLQTAWWAHPSLVTSW